MNKMSLASDSRKGVSRAQAAFEELLQRIVNLELKPFQRLSEASVADMLSLGRTPVREALVRLEALGFVEIRPQRGSIVAPLRISDLEQSQFIRESLEVSLLRRAMENDDREEMVASLEKEVILQRAYLEIGDKESFLESDETFHSLIAEYAGLRGVMAEIARTRAHMDRFRRINVDWGDDLEEVRVQHLQIVSAVKEGDADKAAACLLKHLRRVYVFLEAVHHEYPEYFDDQE
ncbi:GntR family transcriptional regulator [Halocynthiibacter sp. C4]|uniref:GntR family transcriptional regulator n=1 Tax=Halocynthiibacter sp. C4 TaxID=2992758 RepID=UPI00237BB687|nr:GntR family transcriptional regulator [Halocynthiibacter sp. C4]MDE0591490.1 GntR family transcriptional regulator [Halocynthiibacter sp. C4]